MLTFRFTGASGKMTEEEMLTAGMEGKQVRLEFSEEWEGLRKAVVFAAGSRSCTIVDAGEIETIPAQILSESLRRLYVGAYGLTEEGMVVIPAMYATGPFIHIGTSGSGGGTDYVPGDPFWLELEKEVDQTLRYTPQMLTEADQLQARQNIGAAKDKPDAAQLLVTILQDGVYNADQSDNLLHLASSLLDKPIHTISTQLENLPTDNWSIQHLDGNSFRTSLLLGKEYVLETVTVTMGGVDITADVVHEGVVDIPAVTGDVVISGSYYKRELLTMDTITRGYASHSDGKGMQLQATNGYRAILLPLGQYLQSGKTYHFSLGSAKDTYAYRIFVMTASEPDLTFPKGESGIIYYNTITSCVYDSDWQNDDLVYTASGENLVLAVNFKKNVNTTTLKDEDYATLQECFIPEVLA